MEKNVLDEIIVVNQSENIKKILKKLNLERKYNRNNSSIKILKKICLKLY